MFGNSPFDPSKMDPKVLMELSQLIQQLPPEQLNRMRTLMHNAMAGYDVRKEMEEFEKGLPDGFREKIFSLATQNPQAFGGASAAAGQFWGGPQGGGSKIEPISASASSVSTSEQPDSMDLSAARLTVLRAVANGEMSPEDAERALFPED